VLQGTGTINNGSNLLSVNSGGTIGAGTQAAIGTLTTGAQAWHGNGTYQWKLSSTLGSGNATIGSGASGFIGGGNGTEGTNWDLLSLTSLDVSTLGGGNASFSIAPAGNITSTPFATYSWVIAQASGSVNYPAGITPGVLGSTAGTNLLTTPVGGGATAFALNTNGLTDTTAPVSNSQFSLEFETVGGNTDLVLDYAAAPEPGTVLLVMSGLMPLLMSRRRRRASEESSNL
jgi:hypothetical protein